MSTKLSQNLIAGCALFMAAAVWMAFVPAVAQAQQSEPPASGAATASPPVMDAAAPSSALEGAVSEAELHFRKGVDLYNGNLFLEALSEFNRALALNPSLEDAKTFRQKCEAKLVLTSTGASPAETPSFDTIDPGSMTPESETAHLSAQEIKKQRVTELIKMGERYMDHERYAKAVKYFEEALIIAPENARAQEGLHKATLGASKEAISKAGKGIAEDRASIERFIEDSKRLPEGADPTGIKPYRVMVPTVEEEYVEPQKQSPIEKTLESPVSVEFENIHINEIVEFISDSYDINIVVDDRVVRRPPKPVAAAPAQAAPAPTPGPYPGAAGARPGGPGAPGAPQRPPAAAPQQQPQAQQQATAAAGRYVTDGIVPYINLKDVSLREALKALLRPLNLDFAVQPGFIWISTPQNIREESFEALETKYYELRNAGAETLFKIVLRNPGGMGGGGMMGGMGGYGGGMMGGMGGYGGGMMGGMGGMRGGMGGMGGYGGGMGGYGGGMVGGMGGGGGGVRGGMVG